LRPTSPSQNDETFSSRIISPVQYHPSLIAAFFGERF
jgi:hypothetical protein